MFKGTTVNKHYIERTGSSSLRPKRVGDNADLAGWDGYDIDYVLDSAMDELIELTALFKREEALRAQTRKLHEQMQPIAAQMRDTLPWALYVELQAKREKLAAQIAPAQETLTAIAIRRRKLCENQAEIYHQLPRVGDSIEWFVMHLTCRALPKWVVQSIIREAKASWRQIRQDCRVTGTERPEIHHIHRVYDAAQRVLRPDVFAKILAAAEVARKRSKKKALQMERSGI